MVHEKHINDGKTKVVSDVTLLKESHFNLICEALEDNLEFWKTTPSQTPNDPMQPPGPGEMRIQKAEKKTASNAASSVTGLFKKKSHTPDPNRSEEYNKGQEYKTKTWKTMDFYVDMYEKENKDHLRLQGKGFGVQYESKTKKVYTSWGLPNAPGTVGHEMQ
ncbi:MAG: hypothetical protein Q9162_000237 [Coniocarpon cinnabarinum]